MNWNVLITASAMQETGKSAVELLRAAGCKVNNVGKITPPRQVVDFLDGCHAVIAGLEPYTEAVFDSPATRNLRLISRWGVGYDNIDVAAASRRGIFVTNTPGMLAETVADYTFALLLTLARRLHETHAQVCRGEWRQTWGHDLHGRTLGLVGWGEIAQAVARRARGFDMKVLVNTRTRAGEGGAVEFTSLETLLRTSDFVSLHCALTPATNLLISDEKLRLMRPGALFINTARGAMVDEAALAAALIERRIAGAALDVFAREPLPADSPLRQAPNVLLQPHHASFARGAGEKVGLQAARAVLDLMAGRRPAHLLNAASLAESQKTTKPPPGT